MSVEPKHKVFFCSAASRYAKEMLPGTASNYASFILVEYNEPFPSKVAHAKLDDEWREKMNKLAKKKKGKLVLIRNTSTNTKERKIIFVDCLRKRYCVYVSAFDEYTDCDLESYINDEKTEWKTDDFFIVCTNGKKDKCCAKFGFPVYKFMEGVVNTGDVWECTHIGGDRFAANLVYLPYGIYYGRVTVEDIPDIVDACTDNKIHENNYRGISRLSFLKQSVEYYLRKKCNDMNIHFPVRFISQKRDNEDFLFQTETPYGRYEVSVTRQVILYPHLLTCTSKKRENVIKYLLNYIKEI